MKKAVSFADAGIARTLLCSRSYVFHAFVFQSVSVPSGDRAEICSGDSNLLSVPFNIC